MLAGLAGFTALALAQAQALTPERVALQPFSGVAQGAPPPDWRLVGLPDNKAPLTRFDVVQLGQERVLRVRTDKSYGTLSHVAPPAAGTVLQWRWRLEQALAQADLRTKAGDDAALKVCALFDLPLEELGFGDRTLLRLARALSGEKLPAATLCYVWDTTLPAGTIVPNAYSDRVRYMVLDSGSARLGQWVSHRQDMAADYLRSFGSSASGVPPLLAIAVGADADNTGGASLGYVGDIALVKQ